MQEIAGQLGVSGNICADPLFCNASGGDFYLQGNSPCRGHSPESPDCERIGAWPVGCDVSFVDSGASLSAPGIRIIPNPSTGPCRISFGMTSAEAVEGAIFDAGGRLVRTLYGRGSGAGESSLRWDGRGESGQQLPAGLYLVRIAGSGSEKTGRIILTSR